MKELILALILSFPLFSQESLDLTALKTIDPNETFEDLKSLDPLFEGKKIIGIGESTHGSSEFTTMRHRIFKYLVEEKGFTVFFLEADVSKCLRVNRYIHGANDDVREAIQEFGLWPWLTEEMVSLVEWAKDYNQTAIQKIEFVGCDMQFIADDKNALIEYFEGQEILQNVKDIFKDTDSPFGDTITDRRIFNSWSEFSTTLEYTHPELTMDPQYKMIKKSLEQFYGFKFSGKYNYNFRDSSMAENMKFYLELHPGSKGFYFAHNAHVSKHKLDFNRVPDLKMAGRYLSEIFSHEYLSLAMLTNQGSFNARTYTTKDNPNFVFTLKRANKKSIENKLSKFEVPLLFYKVNSDKNLNKLNYTEIGAAYGRQVLFFKTPRYRRLQNGCYDGFFFIESTNPTNLLPMKKD